MSLAVMHQIQAAGKIYNVVDDFNSVYRALITGSVTDEILGSFTAPGLGIHVDRSDMATKTAGNGLFAVSGYSEQSFPNLNLVSYVVNLVVSAPRFRDQKLAVPIPVNATFPVLAVSVALRRKPVAVQGRVVADTATRPPIAGAKIVTVDDPATPPTLHTIALRSPISLPHSAGTTVREIAMAVFGSAQLTSDALSRSQNLNLSSRAGLAPNSVLQLGDAGKTRTEYGIVDSLAPGAGAGQVFLRQPLNGNFVAGIATTVNFLNAGAAGSTATLSRDADQGDGILLASQLVDNTLEIDPGGTAVEYRDAGALTDAAGYYAIYGVGRSAELYFQASHSGFTTQTRGWSVDYDNAVNIFDFRL